MSTDSGSFHATPLRRQLLERLEEWLWTGAIVPAPNVSAVADSVVELSDLYTLERGLLARRQGDREHIGAKLLYFLASDAPKVALVLDECAERDESFATQRHVVDLGCGVGATSVGFVLWLVGRAHAPQSLAITGIDHSPSVLTAWQRTVAKAAELANIDVRLTTICADIAQASIPADADLLLCQTALNERLAGSVTRDAEHDQTTFDAVRRWAIGAPLVIIEPGLKLTSRALQRLRDRLLESGDIRAVAPCPHAAPCPMLARPEDWCHESRLVEPTPMVAAVQTLTRRRDDRAIFSFLALVPGQSPRTSSAATCRIVSDPLGSRGKTERWVCRGDGALRVLRLLDRERRDGNALLVEAERGALVEITPAPPSDRVGPGVYVQRKTPA